MCHVKSQMPKTLAIIGNGFDLAHGYRTRYESFSESVDDAALAEFKEYCGEASIETWHEFENNINILTKRFFMKSYQEDDDYWVNRDKNTHLREIFKRIQSLLADYLLNEISSKPLIIKKTVSKYLNSRSVAINFNYTDTAENYTDKIFYVHGSLREQDIILGYDYRDEACLAQFDDMCWGKTVCRESLAFRRMLSNALNLNADDTEFKRLCSSLEIYQSCESSGRGIDDKPEEYIPDYRFICEFIKNYRENETIPNIEYDRITQLVILGHGIEADRVYLNNIILKCTKLKKIIIFRYNGEADEEFDNKVKFLGKYCTKIETMYY